MGRARQSLARRIHENEPRRARSDAPYLKNWFWKGCKPNSVCTLAGGENHLSGQPIPGIRFAFAKPGAGRSGIPYLALHPMGFSVPRRLRFARCALTAPFHPYPRLLRNPGGLIFCGTVRRKAFQPSARVYPGRTGPGYAASRPLVFGLSSPGSRRKRFSALPKPVGI
jgi:hypothetical protein